MGDEMPFAKGTTSPMYIFLNCCKKSKDERYSFFDIPTATGVLDETNLRTIPAAVLSEVSIYLPSNKLKRSTVSPLVHIYVYGSK